MIKPYTRFDNSSKWIESIQDNFIYQYVESPWPTPCREMNVGIELARAEHVVCMIDSARILLPGVLAKMMQANSLFDNTFVQTFAMHLGDKIQIESISEGYDQNVEDERLKSVDWQQDDYELFNISCLAGSSEKGYLYPISESNCFCVPKKKLLEIKGFDENFRTIGGGMLTTITTVR